MHIDWNLLLCALGLAFVIEGLPYVIFADKLPEMMVKIAKNSPGVLRYLGLVSMICGIMLVWLARM